MASESLPEPGRLQRRPLRVAPLRYRLLHTWPGRLVVVGGAVKLVAWLLRVAAGVEVGAIDALGSLGSLAFIIGLAYFAWRLIVRAKRRLLWRVRRKLILSYIFVGVVPVLLVFAFFLLGDLLLVLNMGSYLVTASIRKVEDDAKFIAQSAAVELTRAGTGQAREVLERARLNAADRYPDASIALVPTSPEPCAGSAADALLSQIHSSGSRPAGKQAAATSGPIAVAGPWSHLAAPTVLPSWVSCTGFAGLLAVSVAGNGKGGTGLIVRSTALPASSTPAFAVVVDIPLDVALREKIRDETSVKVGAIAKVPQFGTAAQPTPESGLNDPSLSLLGLGGTRETSQKRRLPWVAYLAWQDWATGRSGGVTVGLEMNIGDVYDRVSSPGSLSRVFFYGLAILAALFFVIELVALIMGLVLARSITGSIHQLFGGTERVRQGDFGHKIKILTNDQMGELAESFNTMTGSIEDLLRQAEEKKRLEEELRIARAIQMSLLPRGQLAVPGLSITALCVPAREVGGDYYDLLPLDDGRLGVLIADVAGKGTSAALYMAELKGLILSLSRIHTSPRRLLIEANSIIAANLDSRSFITTTYAVIDLRAHTMTYARAGHTPLIHRTGSGSSASVEVLVPDGLVLGLQVDDAGALFERLLKEETIALREGDLLMFFTDGITEAMNAESDCFGESRLGEILAEHGDLPPEELRERILREIDAFVAGAPQHDDMTMILIKVEPMAAAVAGEGATLVSSQYSVDSRQ